MRALGNRIQHVRTHKDTLTEPLKDRKSLRRTSSEKGGCRATRLMKRFRALLRPSMNSLSAGQDRGVTPGSTPNHLPEGQSGHQASWGLGNRPHKHRAGAEPPPCPWGQEPPSKTKTCAFWSRVLGSWVWEHTSVIPELWRLKQPGLHSKILLQKRKRKTQVLVAPNCHPS
jgi:hypothetical protein